jgi:hypothetical protein
MTTGGAIFDVTVKVADCPEHMVGVVVVTEAAGEVLTLIDLITELIHPCMASVIVYVMMVFPLPIPVTTPVLLTLATAVLLLVHTPGVVASVNCIVLFTQTPSGPLMSARVGGGYTEILA